jgi:succinate dehydrogenase / fumarate reductase, cytochrome b subunit
MPEAASIPIQSTSIGRKLLMATSSVILFLYVVLHLVGNLKIFFGPDPFNDYAAWLRVAGSPLFPNEGVLWIARVVLLAALFVHVGAYVQLWRQKRRARTTGYRTFDPQVFNWMSRTMMWGGIAILLFVIFHILHLTTGHIQPDPAAGFQRHDPYENIIAGFSLWWVSGIYVVGVIALGMHLYHGLWSAMQTFGMSNARYNLYRRPAVGAITLLIVIGYLAIPLGVMMGAVR